MIIPFPSCYHQAQGGKVTRWITLLASVGVKTLNQGAQSMSTCRARARIRPQKGMVYSRM